MTGRKVETGAGQGLEEGKGLWRRGALIEGLVPATQEAVDDLSDADLGTLAHQPALESPDAVPHRSVFLLSSWPRG